MAFGMPWVILRGLMLLPENYMSPSVFPQVSLLCMGFWVLFYAKNAGKPACVWALES